MGHGTRECKSKRAIETETVRRSFHWLRTSHILTDELADARNGLLRFREDDTKCCHTCGMPSQALKSTETPAARVPSDHADPFGARMGNFPALSRLETGSRPVSASILGPTCCRSRSLRGMAGGHHRWEVDVLGAFVPLHCSDLYVQIRRIANHLTLKAISYIS